jgi:hypothetical protein
MILAVGIAARSSRIVSTFFFANCDFVAHCENQRIQRTRDSALHVVSSASRAADPACSAYLSVFVFRAAADVGCMLDVTAKQC